MSQFPILTDNVRVVENALVVPPVVYRGPCGVFEADGRFVEESREYTSPFEPVPAPPVPDHNDEVPFQTGTYLYGGWMQGHFGHVLVETVARSWAIDSRRSELDGFVLISRGPRTLWNSRRKHRPILDFFYQGLQDLPLSQPRRFERLIVPDAGCGVGLRMKGSAAFRKYVQSLSIPADQSSLPDKIYISRRKLRASRGRFTGEGRLVQALKSAGYVEVHPQKMTFEKQVQIISNARFIISPDGSPLHLASYFARPDAKVAMIVRRLPETPTLIAAQFEHLQGRSMISVNEVKRIWKDAVSDRIETEVLSEIDLERAIKVLAAGQMISAIPEIANLSGEEVAAEISSYTRGDLEVLVPHEAT
ncbi:glycosyltransferase family 61 protein [Yoonia litorea]|uniref:Glycosyltransferase 61 catalytic domain-containing protein n=1 Tax=Yoonia litorea TaxID=1123755 RepID=A0A1I6KZC0_9RHOB|nr:glycosyltransferase family 61 protein [Yoonia litorea]SFR96569.1 Protein of unknown function [Yoonia litorea]